MSIGIYMPAYNVENYIIEAIKSIEGQTYKDWELVILDDCSTDNTFEIASKYVKSKSRISIFKREERCGKIGKLKNETIGKLDQNHKYICHLGSDDRMPNNVFDVYLKNIENTDIGMLCGSFLCFDDSGKQWMYPHVKNSGPFDKGVLLKFMNGFPMRFYRWDVIRQVGGYSNELASAVDYDITLKVSEVAKIKRVEGFISYFYRQHQQQVSTNARPHQNLNAKKALSDALKRRGIEADILNDAPPFNIEIKTSSHFIWGKK